MKIGPSIVSADLTCLINVVKILENNGIDFYHVDVMDGNFVPNITVGPDFVKTLRKITEKPIEAHLMISRPDLYVERFIDSGADMITVHIENEYYNEALNKMSKVRKGIAINPETALEKIIPILDKIDFVLVMTVHPGFSGQKFIESVVPKMKKLKEIQKNYNFEISVDGGINKHTIIKVKDYVDMVCAASGIFSGDITENIKALRI
ncbi:MAG: ribulose-phosphate 3-epimerase [Thermoplasmata archaeon]|nr:ribulose-phosphate 3-epimerase [Thermoplasmata archaeon]